MKENKSVSQSQALNPFEWVHQLVRASNHCQLSSVQDGIHALRKSHMLSTLSLRSFRSVAFEMAPMFV